MVRTGVLLVAPWLAALALAQQPPPQLPFVPTPQDLRPRPAVPDTPVEALPDRRAPPPRELGKPDADLRIDVQAFTVDDDAPAELRAALPALTAPYTGKARRFEDLSNAADAVSRFLQRELGDYLGYAYLPEQDPQDGVVRIAVLEGRLDRVILNWPEGMPVQRSVVEAYLAHLEPGQVLKVRDVERVVFLVNDLRGLTAQFEVRAGEQPGTAALVVTPRPEVRWSGRAEADTNGSRHLGRYELGGLVQANSPFGRGDGLTANALASTTGGLLFALLSYATPVGSDGIKVGSSVSAVRYQLDKAEFPIDLNGDALTLNAYGLYPVVRARNLNLFTLLSLDDKRYVDRQGSSGQTRKRIDNLTLGATGDFRDSQYGGAVSTFSGTAVAGRVNYPDGRSTSLTDAPHFTKLNALFTRLQDVVTGRALAYLSLRGQYAFNNLDTTEQFRIGGPDGVRAYAPGEGTGDNGIQLTLELRVLPPDSWFGRNSRDMVLSAFYDAGWVQYRTDTSALSELQRAQNKASFSGIGVGLSWVRPDEYALRMSLSNPISGTPRSDPQVLKPRLYLLLTKFFV